MIVKLSPVIEASIGICNEIWVRRVEGADQLFCDGVIKSKDEARKDESGL